MILEGTDVFCCCSTYSGFIGYGDGANARNYWRCKSKLVNGLKCIEYKNFSHLSCAKLTNTVSFIDENTIKCCGRKEENEEHDGLIKILNDMSDN